jgi:polar amino acid transport system ATP-binding protein
VRTETLIDCKEHTHWDDSVIRQKRRHFGLVFQAFNLFPQYTAFENITLARELEAEKRADFKKNKKSIIEDIRKEGMVLLDQMGLSETRDLYPHQLSGGQQQRVAIARALALKPDILCFDEPTSALDPELTGEVLKVIRSLAEKNTTMIIVTHEMQFARQVADTILFMDEGVTVEYGKPELLDNPSSDRLKRFLERYS